MPRRVVQEEIDRGVELELVEAARDEVLSGSETFGLKQIESSALDLAAIDLAEQLVGIDAGTGQLRLVDAPDTGDVAAVLGVADVAPAGQLIALLSVLAPALPVRLADDRAVAALRLADAPDASTRLIVPSAFCTPLEWCSMPRAWNRKLVLAVPHHSAACIKRPLRHAGHLGGPRSVHCAAILRDLIEADRVLAMNA